MKKLIIGIGIGIVAAIILVAAFVHLVEVPHQVEHRYTEISYGDDEPSERLVIRYETHYETATLFEYLFG